MRRETNDDSELRLSLPARSENLSRIRRAVSEFAESLGVDEEVIADVRLALTEACSNVVRHAYRQPGGTIDVTAECADGHIGIRVQDTGRGHRPDTNPVSDSASSTPSLRRWTQRQSRRRDAIDMTFAMPPA